jgi:hypothetical protein
MLPTTYRQASEILSNPDNGRVPYTFSTDRWTPEVVCDLRERLSRIQTPKEKAVGVVIGSGGLRYILAYAGISKAYMVDVHAEVILANMMSIRFFRHHQSWLTYRNALYENLSMRDSSRFKDESNRAAQTRLMDDYALTRQNALSTALWGLAGDFRRTAADISKLATKNDEVVTYVNVTNVADLIRSEQTSNDGSSGMLVLGRAIGALPLANDAVIVDSSGGLVPKLYTKENYPGVQLGEYLSALDASVCEQ